MGPAPKSKELRLATVQAAKRTEQRPRRRQKKKSAAYDPHCFYQLSLRRLRRSAPAPPDRYATRSVIKLSFI